MPRTILKAMNGLATAAVLLAASAGCERTSEGKARPEERHAPIARVEVVRPERQTVRRSVGEPGQVVAFETTAIHAKIPGYVKGWTVNIGDAVKKGQVLAELSVPELEAEFRQKRAAVEQAVARHKQAEASVKVAEADIDGAGAKLAEVRAGVSRAQADLDRWQAEYRRVEGLFQARAQTGSLVDETRNKLRSSESARAEIDAQVKTAEVALEQSRAALERARSDVGAAAAAIEADKEDAGRVGAMLGYTKIAAPFDGIVTRRNIDTGQLTRPGSDSDPLYILARSDVVTFIVDVPEVFAAELNPGDPATFELQAMKGKAVAGKVTRTSWALDPRTRTLRVEVDVPNPGGKLRPGLYAYATIVVEEHPDVLTVPATAVVREKDKAYCVLVNAGKAVLRPVEVGLSDGTKAEVVSGLDGNETVVKANSASLTDGQPIEPIEPANPPAPGAKP
jgi:RND family efflux transporter MFP subunit